MAKYHLHLAHLYGDLLNTYGDIGNIIALKYYAKQMDTDIQVDVVSSKPKRTGSKSLLRTANHCSPSAGATNYWVSTTWGPTGKRSPASGFWTTIP